MQSTSIEDPSKRVKTLRKKMGWSHEKLSNDICVYRSTVQRWELKKAQPSRLARKGLGKLLKRAGIE